MELVIGFFQESMETKIKDSVFREHMRRWRILHTHLGPHLGEGLIHFRGLKPRKGRRYTRVWPVDRIQHPQYSEGTKDWGLVA